MHYYFLFRQQVTWYNIIEVSAIVVQYLNMNNSRLLTLNLVSQTTNSLCLSINVDLKSLIATSSWKVKFNRLMSFHLIPNTAGSVECLKCLRLQVWVLRRTHNPSFVHYLLVCDCVNCESAMPCLFVSLTAKVLITQYENVSVRNKHTILHSFKPHQ